MLKHVLKKVQNAAIGEACLLLNLRIRPGSKATPLSLFFGSKTRGDLPNMFGKLCHIMKTVKQRIKNQFSIAQRRGYWNCDSFKIGDRVIIHNPAIMEWTIFGKVSKKIESSEGSVHSYKILTDQGQTLVHNGTQIHHSEMAEKENKEQS